LLRLRIGHEAADDAVLQIDRKPAEAEEAFGERTVRIAHPQRSRFAADVHDQPHVADDELVGLWRAVVAQFDRMRHGLTIEKDGRSGVWLERHDPVVANEAPHLRRHRCWQDDGVRARAAHRAGAWRERMKSRDAGPIAAVVGLVLCAPLLGHRHGRLRWRCGFTRTFATSRDQSKDREPCKRGNDRTTTGHQQF
jgi:hypothetical protein